MIKCPVCGEYEFVSFTVLSNDYYKVKEIIMTVIYHERKGEYRCPYLTEGKEYKVEDIHDIPDEGRFYEIENDYEGEDGFKDTSLYSVDMFEIIREI